MRSCSAIAMVVSIVLLAGCAGAAVGISSSNSPSMGGSLPPLAISRSSAGIQAEVRPNSYFGLIFLGYAMIGVTDAYRHWSEGPDWRKPPELAEDRAVAERDCREPLGPLYANLRCK